MHWCVCDLTSVAPFEVSSCFHSADNQLMVRLFFRPAHVYSVVKTRQLTLYTQIWQVTRGRRRDVCLCWVWCAWCWHTQYKDAHGDSNCTKNTGVDLCWAGVASEDGQESDRLSFLYIFFFFFSFSVFLQKGQQYATQTLFPIKTTPSGCEIQFGVVQHFGSEHSTNCSWLNESEQQIKSNPWIQLWRQECCG